MAKTRAEIQKAYRERKKAKEGSAYLDNEVKRVQKYYHRTVNLSKTELEKRREKIRESVNKHRASRRRRANEEATTSNSRLLVKIDFNKGRKKTPTSRRARKKIASLEERISHLERANKRVSKRYERLVKGGSAKRSTNADEMTPRSRTNNQLRKAGLNPKKADESLKRRLLFSNVLVDEIRESAQENKTTAGKQAIRNIICGRIVKKYRLIRAMAGATKLVRNSLMRSTSKSCTIQKRTR